MCQTAVCMLRSCAIKKQTGVTLRYMLDFGANPVQRQLILSAQFLHNELPVRLAHRVAELENLPYGLSAKPHVLKVQLTLTSFAPDSSNFRSTVLPRLPDISRPFDRCCKKDKPLYFAISRNDPATAPGSRLVCGVFHGVAVFQAHPGHRGRSKVH